LVLRRLTLASGVSAGVFRSDAGYGGFAMKRSTLLQGTVLSGGLLMVLALGTMACSQGGGGKTDDQKADGERTTRFSEKDLGKVPTGWTVDKTGRGEGSLWKVVADDTSPSKTGYVLAQTAKSPGNIFNLCILDDSKYRDVEIEVAFKSVKGRIDQGGGPVWRYQDANNYYIARFNPLEDNYRFYKVVDGRRTQLATKENIKVPAGEWHTLEIEHVGNRIECELDGKVILTATDDSIEKAGKVGLWTKADAQTYFDKFTVEEETGDDDGDDKDDDGDDKDDDGDDAEDE
jgi:hypothetical protein